jgi:hypothetical protein
VAGLKSPEEAAISTKKVGATAGKELRKRYLSYIDLVAKVMTKAI